MQRSFVQGTDIEEKDLRQRWVNWSPRYSTKTLLGSPRLYTLQFSLCSFSKRIGLILPKIMKLEEEQAQIIPCKSIRWSRWSSWSYYLGGFFYFMCHELTVPQRVRNESTPSCDYFKSNSEAEIWENLEEVKVSNSNLKVLSGVTDGFIEKTLSHESYQVVWRERRIHLFANYLWMTCMRQLIRGVMLKMFLSYFYEFAHRMACIQSPGSSGNRRGNTVHEHGGT